MSPVPDAVGLGVELIPADDDAISPADALKAAAASAVDEPTGEVIPEAPQPLGLSWAFDWDHNRFIRQGHAPAEVRGLDALREWCLMTVNSARYAYAVFSDDFGVERPDDLIGELDVDEMVSDFEERIREALLVHDRITGVEDFDADWDPETGVLTINEFDVVTDDDLPLDLGGVQLHTRGTA